MKTAPDREAVDHPGAVSIHRLRPEAWLHRPSHSIGLGPWLPRSWPPHPREPALLPLALAYRGWLAERDAAKTWRQLHELVDGAEPVVVNDAEPRRPNLFLRRMLAEWLGRELAEEVKELDGSAPTSASILGVDPWTYPAEEGAA